ncbi:MAG TPA: hypothetical protein VMB72_13780 [Acidimicrobiales bacterium]|nr:hypothetical protein [Acidimicrobiales bacterium]
MGLLGAVIGYLTAPAPPSSAAAATPKYYSATSLVAPSLGRHAVSRAALFLDVKNSQVLSIAAADSHTGLSPAQLDGVVTVVNGRTALGLPKKGDKGIAIHAFGIQVTWFSADTAAALANAVAAAVAKYISQEAQTNYATATAAEAKKVALLRTRLNDVDGQISGASPATASLSQLVVERRQLTNQLGVEFHNQIVNELDGPKVPGYQVIRQALAKPVFAHKLTVASVVNHKSTRILGGLLIGILLAVGIILLVEVLDHSLRTTRATEEAFDLPVVAEIPARPVRRSPFAVAPSEARLELVADPFSAIAASYRRLHTAVLLEPLAAEMALLVGNGYGNGYASANGYANGNGNGSGNGNGHGNGHGNGNGFGNGYGYSPPWGPPERLPQAASPYPVDPANGGELIHEGNGGRSKRQVVLVVSPGSEPSRSAVVANLAAVYAEAGAQALVITMGDLQWGRSLPMRTNADAEAEIVPEDLVPLSTPSAVDGVSRLQFDQLLATRGQVVTQGPAIITAARQVADAVLIDAPALLRSHDAIALMPAVDVVLVVAQHGLTRSDEAREAGDTLRRFRAPVLGVVLTEIPSRERVRRADGNGADAELGPAPAEVVLEQHYEPPAEPASTGSKLWL